jgi:SAM-dependent methyltransferase
MVKAFTARWTGYRARRTWNGFARTAPREITATHDAADWDDYWASGERDLQVLLDVASRAGVASRRRAVEIGAGLGRITRKLAEHCDDVIGLDISSEMLAQAQELAARANLRYALIRGDGRLPVDSGTAGIVVAWTVFRHVSEDVFAAYLAEAQRILEPGGVVVFDSQVRESGPVERARHHRPFPEREYTRTELAGLCSRAGLSWAADRTLPSATEGTATLVTAWVKPVPVG